MFLESMWICVLRNRSLYCETSNKESSEEIGRVFMTQKSRANNRVYSSKLYVKISLAVHWFRLLFLQFIIFKFSKFKLN